MFLKRKPVEPLGVGSNIMDLEDFVVSSLILTLGSLTFVLFCTTKYGWGWGNFIKRNNIYLQKNVTFSHKM